MAMIESNGRYVGALEGNAVEEFRLGLAGMIVRPGEPEYDTARAVWNGMIDRRPAIIAYCANVNDVIRSIAMGESLCISSSSVCKHWKRVVLSSATRATFPGQRRFHPFQRQVVRTDLMRCAGNHLHGRKDAGFDKAPYRVVCDA
jgi:hypothetical protein